MIEHRSTEELIAELRTAGLYEDQEDWPEEAEGKIVVMRMFVGDRAFTSIVQEPEQHDFDREFREITRSFTQDAFQREREELMRHFEKKEEA